MVSPRSLHRWFDRDPEKLDFGIATSDILSDIEWNASPKSSFVMQVGVKP
jgi:hypothetical protein